MSIQHHSERAVWAGTGSVRQGSVHVQPATPPAGTGGRDGRRDVGRAELLLPALVIACVLALLLPLPAFLVDVALSLQLMFAVLVALACARPLSARDLALLPTLLVTCTCARLALNVATTRLILTDTDAGEVVSAFGTVAIADNLLAGAVIFAIVALAQLLVVTRGAERVAEVSARFSLDAMPGAQMAIDADVRAGFIDADEARRRRQRLTRESRLFGAMDGAMRFVKGDALVALVIALVNVLVGTLAGVAVHGMGATASLQTYLTLAIGDGLAAQIPALLLALAAGLALTRSASAESPDVHQSDPSSARSATPVSGLLRPSNLIVGAALFTFLAVMPGAPGLPFLITAGLAGAGWLWLRRARTEPDIRQPAGELGDASEPSPITVELNAHIAARVDATRPNGQFSERVLAAVRTHLARCLGTAPPAIALRVGSVDGYRLWLRDLVIDSAEADELAASPDELRAVLELRIRTALDRRGYDLLDVQSVGAEVRRVARQQPDLVDAALPALITRVQLAALARDLARERIALGDMACLLRAVCAACVDGPIADPEQRLARVRAALRDRISEQFAPAGVLSVWRLDPFVEDTIRGALTSERETGHGRRQLALEPELSADITEAVARAVAAADVEPGDGGGEAPAVLLVASDVRRHIAELIAVAAPTVAVLAPQDVSPHTRVHTAATIGV